MLFGVVVVYLCLHLRFAVVGRVKVKLKSFLARRPTYEEMKKKGLIKGLLLLLHYIGR